MERGPLPISRAPPPASSSSSSDLNPHLCNNRSVNGNLGEAMMPRGNARVSRNARSRSRRAHEDNQEENDEDNDEEEAVEGGGGERGRLTELATELRRFGEGYARIERKKIEMKREMEREWMEMESRRLEMVMEAQRCLVETIAGAFWKKAKSSKDL
ncbi:hypothetical protein KSP39_PZI016652 [Platanthera zijinensis]|uniref:Trihelix transcription factor ASIL2 n=1 Tax=Platanthera zijinensis TaxID=2320716 RepID=A0AAP0B8W5_9ASPA